MTAVESSSGSAFAILVALSILSAAPEIALAACRLAKFELPVTMSGHKPMISARVNGAAALFIADSGASFNVMPPGEAARLGLPVGPAPFSLHLGGVTGEGAASLATVRTFTLGGVPISDVEFFVVGNEMAAGAAGVLGESVLGMFDTEYDLANGMIRLMQARDCGRSVLAYWATNQSYSVVDLERSTARDPQIIGTAYLNGEKIRVLFDTGAPASIVRLRAAQRAGARPGEPGVVPAGFIHGAIGQRELPSWIAPFASFKIGDEEILNTRLRIGDIRLRDSDMLLGVDFFLSHRIYVASSQGKVYFTYNGGPVFDLSIPPPPSGGASDEPRDAVGFARRGSAYTARHEFKRAIADLTRACELAPTEADYFYERGVARLGNRQPELALADFDESLKLAPDNLPTLAARAALRTERGDPSGATADLDAADRLAARDAMIRLQLGELYARAGQFERGIAQLDLWIGAHRGDAGMAAALNGRCRARAQWGRELDQALKDCNAALRLNPTAAAFLDSRGLVRLRRGELGAAIADYDAALKLNPARAWALYGRGVARLRQGLTDAGRADIAAATALEPHIAAAAGARGIAP